MDEAQAQAAITTWSPILYDAGYLIGLAWDRSRKEVGATDDPCMVSVQLFKRLRDHRNAFVTLINGGFHLESEIILRSAIEVAICLLNLDERREDFIADLRSDAAKTLKSQIPIWFGSDPGRGQEAASGLHSIFGDRRPDGSKHMTFQWSALADQTQAPDLYAWYRHLSATSVHVSGLSVFRDSTFIEDDDADGRLGTLRRLGRVHALSMMCGAAVFGSKAHVTTLGHADLLRIADIIMGRMAEAGELLPR